MKRAFAIVMAVILSMATMSACKPKDENVVSREAFTLRMVSSAPESRALSEYFSERFPNATLVQEYQGTTTIDTLLEGEFLQNHGPDIFMMFDYDRFAAHGYLADLTTEDRVLSRFQSSALRDMERDGGKVYALPLGGGSLYGLCYNVTLFDRYNLDHPSGDESIFDLVERVGQAIDDAGLTDVRPFEMSLLYPTEITFTVNSVLSEFTQTSSFFSWLHDYRNGNATFEDEAFQTYLQQVEKMVHSVNSGGARALGSGRFFESIDTKNTMKEKLLRLIGGDTFMSYGSVSGLEEYIINTGDALEYELSITGVPSGANSINSKFVSFRDDTYIGVNADFDKFSAGKQLAIRSLLDFLSTPEGSREVVSSAPYHTNYINGVTMSTSDKPLFSEINEIIASNSVASNVSSIPYSSVFGGLLIYWTEGLLNSYTTLPTPGQQTPLAKATNILENYRKSGVNPFVMSDDDIGESARNYPFVQSLMRTQETALGNLLADAARDYYDADFAILNAGAVRSSIYSGTITSSAVGLSLPYRNHLIKVRIKGSTVKKILQRGYKHYASFKSGAFALISGLRVKYGLDDESWARFSGEYNAWLATEDTPSAAAINEKIREIVVGFKTAGNELNTALLSEPTTTDGSAIEDGRYYTVATSDYLLQGLDEYTMCGVLSTTESVRANADEVQIFNRANEQVTGADYAEILAKINSNFPTLAAAMVEWLKEGNTPTSVIDGRIDTAHERFVYYN